MKRGLTGEYDITSIAGERVKAFVPWPLPPVAWGFNPGPDVSNGYILKGRGQLNGRLMIKAGNLREKPTCKKPEPG